MTHEQIIKREFKKVTGAQNVFVIIKRVFKRATGDVKVLAKFRFRDYEELIRVVADFRVYTSGFPAADENEFYFYGKHGLLCFPIPTDWTLFIGDGE